MGSDTTKDDEVSAKQKKLNDNPARIIKDKKAARQQRAEEAARQQDAEEAEKQRAEEAEKQRSLDAEIIPLNMNGPDGKFDHDVRLNGTLQELTDQVLLKLGLPKKCAKGVEMHLSGYKLEPVTKTVREFTELCVVTRGWCHFGRVTDGLIAGLRD